MPRGLDRWEEAHLQDRNFDPRNEPSLVGWYDIGDLSTLAVSSSGTVSAIRDKSFTGRNAVIGGGVVTGVNVPLTMRGGPFKNRPALTCTATAGQYFTISNGLGYDGTAGRTIVAVVERNSYTTDVRSVFSSKVVGGMQLRWSTAHKIELVRANSAALVTAATTASLGYHVMGVTYSTGSIIPQLDGATETFAVEPGNFAANDMILANSNNTVVTEYFHGEFLELMYFSTKLSTERYNRIAGYLAWKHGLQGGLYGTVPYRNNPPLM